MVKLVLMSTECLDYSEETIISIITIDRVKYLREKDHFQHLPPLATTYIPVNPPPPCFNLRWGRVQPESALLSV